jgi:glycyl-tRNA synthetase alpha chain
LKPSPPDVQRIYLRSLERLGIVLAEHDVRFEEDNWEAPTLGAWGVGWQVADGRMEISQFTYFQQAGGIDLSPITAEITYGLERIAMFLSKVNSVLRRDVERLALLRRGPAPGRGGPLPVRFRDRDVELQSLVFDRYEREAGARSKPAACWSPTRPRSTCSHAFNILDARGAVSATDRVGFIRRVRDLACAVRARTSPPRNTSRRRGAGKA